MDGSLRETIDKVQLRVLRARILVTLDEVYPAKSDDVILRDTLTESCSARTIRRELHYLSEKGLASISEMPDGSLHAAITAKGRDLVMGEFKVVGIQSAVGLR